MVPPPLHLGPGWRLTHHILRDNTLQFQIVESCCHRARISIGRPEPSAGGIPASGQVGRVPPGSGRSQFGPPGTDDDDPRPSGDPGLRNRAPVLVCPIGLRHDEPPRLPVPIRVAVSVSTASDTSEHVFVSREYRTHVRCVKQGIERVFASTDKAR